jgi:SAM-dependent methyltransferase
VGVALIPQYVPEGKLLEIGCAAGNQLLFFRQIGWEHLYGVELVADVAEIARARGFSVESGPIETVLDNYPDEHFDVVFSTMTLEHMYDPFQVVRNIARKLKPGGQFLFSTIVRGSLDEKRYGKYWLHYDFPRHMVYFRKTDLYEMLEDRFEQIECFHQGAPQDFIWGATWRYERDGKSDFIDQIILRLDRCHRAQLINMYLAWLGLTSRVSFRCRRKCNEVDGQT